MTDLSRRTTKLVADALAMESESAAEAGTLGYMARALVQATIPHSKTEGTTFIRTNGDYRLSISNEELGLPYGSIPRLLLAWLATEATRTKSREIILGSSLSEFMGHLDMVPTGGRKGTITMFKKQAARLFSSTIRCSYTSSERYAVKNIVVADEADIWWSPSSPGQHGLMDSTVKLSQPFYDEILNNPVPVDMRALQALRKSPMALDLYCWSTYRVSYLKGRAFIPWEGLQAQFGSSYPDTQRGKRNFKTKFVEALKKVALVYPGLNADPLPDGLELRPSRTHIPKTVVADD
jgi:hypothetical protein